MKSFKTLFILGCLAVTFIIGMIVGNAIVSDTVDFNGKIVSISESTRSRRTKMKNANFLSA